MLFGDVGVKGHGQNIEIAHKETMLLLLAERMRGSVVPLERLVGCEKHEQES